MLAPSGAPCMASDLSVTTSPCIPGSDRRHPTLHRPPRLPCSDEGAGEWCVSLVRTPSGRSLVLTLRPILFGLPLPTRLRFVRSADGAAGARGELRVMV